MSENRVVSDQPTQPKSDCEAIRALLPAYCLGAADPDERELVEARLAACPEVADELAEYMAVGEALLFSAPAVEPPPRLLESLMAATAPAKREDALRRQRGPLSRLFSLRQRALGTALAALAVVILLVANVYWVVQVGQLREHQAALYVQLREQEALLTLMGVRDSNSWVRLVPTQAEAPSYAVLVWTRGVEDENTWVALLNAKNLPTLSPDKAYQLWFVRGDKRVSGGLFQVDEHGDGTLLFRTAEPLGSFERFGITQEPASGSEWPTSDPVVSGET